RVRPEVGEMPFPFLAEAGIRDLHVTGVQTCALPISCARSAGLPRLRPRLDELAQGADPARVEQELVLALQKLDVDEELDRLASHVDEIRRVFTQREPVGRRLDFLLQEFNREANTLGSKSVDARTSRAAVELKVL